MRRHTIAAYAAALLAAATISLATADAAQAPFDIKIIALNDFHGNIAPPTGTTTAPSTTTPGTTVRVPTGGVAFLSTLLAQLKAENPQNAVVGAGDLIGASPLVSALFHDEAAIETLNLLGIDYAAVGNHEFDKGKSELKRMQNGGCYENGTVGVDTCIINGSFSGANFKYLAANVVKDKTGETLFPAYKVKKFTGPQGKTVKMAFIGLVLEGTPAIVTPSGVEGLTFKDEAETVNALVPVLQSRGIQSIVVVIHQGGTTTGLYDDPTCPGFSGDIKGIVNALDPAVDLVISGHTHQAYICKAKASDGVKDITVTSGGFYGRMLTDLDVTVDPKTKDITAIGAHNILVVNDGSSTSPPTAVPEGYVTLAKDPNQQSLIDTYNALAAPLANAKIGSISSDISRTQNVAGESALGDVIADAQLAATSAPEFGGARAAFMNPGGIRADLLYNNAYYVGEPAGDIAYGEAFNVQPFYNTLVTMTLSGAQIKAVLEQQFDNPAVGQNRFMEVSNGFAYTYDAAQPTGSKVVAGSIQIDGVTVDPAASYRVTCNSFMATGGDNFTVFASGTDRLGGALDIDALSDYLEAHSPVPPGPQNRVTRIN